MTTVQMSVAFDDYVITNHDTMWLKRYSKFANKKDFNTNWEMMMSCVKRQLTPYQHKILNRIRKFAWEVPGVANASYKRYIEAISRDLGHDVSEDTIRRAIQKAEGLGLLRRFKGRRLRNTSQAANVIIFNRYEDTPFYSAVNGNDELTDDIIARLDAEFEANRQMWDFTTHVQGKIEQRRQEKERAAAAAKAAEEEQKRKTLYARIKAHLAAKKMNMSDLKVYAGVLYGSIKKARENDPMLSQEQAEKIAWQAFLEMTSKNDNEIKNNRVALLSYSIKRRLKAIIDPAAAYSDIEILSRQAKAKGGYVEIKPDWFDNRNKEKKDRSKDIDIEAEKARIAQKMGW